MIWKYRDLLRSTLGKADLQRMLEENNQNVPVGESNVSSVGHAVISVLAAIEKEGYIPKLVDLFHVCEDLDNMEGLKLLHKICTVYSVWGMWSGVSVGSGSMLLLVWEEQSM